MYSGTAYLLVTTLTGVVIGGMFICVLVMYIKLLMVIRHQEKSIEHGPARPSAVWNMKIDFYLDVYTVLNRI